MNKTKPMGKTVHARDWRRLEILSPTYATTHFKIMDNMLIPDVPVVCKTVIVPKVVYDTSEKRRMDSARQELEVISDKMKKTLLLNRLEIWGGINGEEARKVKNEDEKRRTMSQLKGISAQMSRITVATGSKYWGPLQPTRTLSVPQSTKAPKTSKYD